MAFELVDTGADVGLFVAVKRSRRNDSPQVVAGASGAGSVHYLQILVEAFLAKT